MFVRLSTANYNQTKASKIKLYHIDTNNNYTLIDAVTFKTINGVARSTRSIYYAMEISLASGYEFLEKMIEWGVFR